MEAEETAVSDKLELRNFVGGDHVDATDGRRMDLVDPATGRGVRHGAVSAAEDVDRAYAAAAGAFEGWRDATPSERQLALLRFADAVEQHADELVAAGEPRTPASRIGLTTSEEIPPMVDQIRFFAGAARCWRARRRRSTWPATRPTSAASRSASSARSRRGTTR